MFALLAKIPGLVWGTEKTANESRGEQHTVGNNAITRKKKPPRLRKDLFGKVTRLYDSAGVIEEAVYFTFDSVIGGIRPEIGTRVHVEAWRETETSGWKATRVQVITEWDFEDEEVNNAVETFIGTITNITPDSGVVDNNITFKLSCVRLGYAPYQGDWVKLDLERLTDGTVEVKGVMPLREKSFTGTVTYVSAGFGYIDNDVLFSCGVCSRGFRACRGDMVRVTAVESQQGRAVWRAIKVEPKRQSASSSPARHSQMFMGGRMAELIRNKEGITITDQLEFGDVLVGESKSLNVLISNKSSKTQKLQSCTSPSPSVQFSVQMADNVPAQSEPLSVGNAKEEKLSVTGSWLTLQEIPPNQAKHVLVVCTAKNLGRVNHLLVFNFGGFEIGRYLTANVQDPDQTILQPCAPYQRQYDKSRDAWRKFSDLTCGEECIIPGEKPLRKRKLFLPVKLAMYNIPKDIRRCIVDGKDIGSIVYSLKEPLSLKNYSAKFSTLLYAEELQMEMDMRQFDMTNVSMNACGEFLSLQVPGLAEGRPSVLIGDKIVVLLSGSSSDAPKYEGYVHEIHKDDILLKFSEEFHVRFGMQECDVVFYFNRTTLRRCHRAVEFAVSLGEKVLFPRKLSPKLPSLSPSSRGDPSSQQSNGFVEPDNRRGEGCFLYNKSLNERQKAAVCRISGGQCRPTPYLLFGPPGTGKTITIVEAILQVFHGLASSRVLACTPSNSAADLIAERLHHSGYIQKGDMVRLNAAQRVQSIPEAISQYCTDTDELDTAAYYRVIVCTCSTAGQLYSLGLQAGHFTHVFVDEAGQATEPECLVAVGLAAGEDGQVVLAGDPFQLGPVLQSSISSSYGLGISLLERLMSRPLYLRDEERFSDHGCYDPLLVTKLVNNYRSHPAVLRLPSAIFYHDELEPCAEQQMRESLSQWSALPNKGFPVIFHGLKGEDVREGNSPSWFNPVEAVQVVKYLQSLRFSKEISLKLTDIGVITPYRKQVEKLRLLLDRLGLDEVKVGSVEEFQGQERLVVIISTVRSNESLVGLDVRHSVGFLSNPKRFNVAITRAQALLIVVGNPHVLCQDPYWCCLLQYCVMNDAYVGCDLPSLDQQILKDEFKAAMELLNNAVASDPSKMNDNLSQTGKSDGEQKPEHTQSDPTDVTVELTSLHKTVPREKFAFRVNNLAVNQVGKSPLPCFHDKIENCDYSSTLSRNRSPKGEIGDSGSGDQTKRKQSETNQRKKQSTAGADSKVADEVRTSQLGRSRDNAAELTSDNQRRNNVNNDSDDELEEFVFMTRNNEPPTTALV